MLSDVSGRPSATGKGKFSHSDSICSNTRAGISASSYVPPMHLSAPKPLLDIMRRQRSQVVNGMRRADANRAVAALS
ncbi:MAG: hypothetical protein GPOALKHO_000371 [Sodalis sp.]|nr:MAG: hypothetical protein GPOALKHO_000371 [Sodalis sp.]